MRFLFALKSHMFITSIKTVWNSRYADENIIRYVYIHVYIFSTYILNENIYSHINTYTERAVKQHILRSLYGGGSSQELPESGIQYNLHVLDNPNSFRTITSFSCCLARCFNDLVQTEIILLLGIEVRGGWCKCKQNSLCACTKIRSFLKYTVTTEPHCSPI